MSNLVTVQPRQHQPSQHKTGFDLQPSNVQEAMSLATMIANSQLAPKSFTGKPEDTLVAMMLGNELGLNPIQSIQNIAVVNGRPSIYGDAMLALVQNHPKFGSIDESFDDDSMTAICTVVRKGGKPHTQKYSQIDAETASLWDKSTWKQHPKRMLALRARGFALRNQFADALLGLISTEEAEDYAATDVAAVDDFYPQDQFDKNYPAWAKLIQSGKKTAPQMIEFLNKKTQLSEKQIELLTNVEVTVEVTEQ